jgi:putative Mg2+ transporter-C (MgtC) family protein
VSIESAYVFERAEHITMDPLRLAAQIVSGIGFLGAGVILRRGNDSISGLTTAAMIWGAAGIGIAVGSGFFIEAITGVVLLIISVELLPFILRFFGPKQLREKEILLQLKVSAHHNITDIINDIKKNKVKLTHIRIKDLETGEQFIQVKIRVPQKKLTTDVYYEVRKIEGVRSIEVENL